MWNQPFQNTAAIPNAPCVSLFHRNGRVGCSTSDRDASNHKGMLVHASTLDTALSANPQLWSVPPLVVMMEEYEFNSETLEHWKTLLQQTLRGVVVLSSYSTQPSNTPYRSPASMYPFSTSYAWNLEGDDLLDQDLYGMPTIYTLDATQNDDLRIMAIQQTHQLADYNKQHTSQSTTTTVQELQHWKDTSLYPAMVAEIQLYMGPPHMDSPTCLAWTDADAQQTWNPKCLPLGGNSVWATIIPQNSTPMPIILVATNMDATSMFHDIAPGANTAASNILVLLMTARLLGQIDSSVVSWDSLSRQVVFAAFQGENFGQIGSKTFLQDAFFPGFQCESSHLVSQSTPHTQPPQPACLFPLRHDLAFTSLSQNDIDSMIAIDQLGLLQSSNTFYLHHNAVGAYQDLIDIFLELNEDQDSFEIQQSSTQQTIPPSGPLLSLYQLSQKSVGGIVLTGYDTAFVDTSYYMSHLDSHQTRHLDLTALAKASTLLARTILAYAIGDLNQNTIEWVKNVIPNLNATSDASFSELANCLLEDGYCNLFLKYAKMQQANTLAETGVDLGLGTALGKPPNFYPSIYDASNGQAFVQMSGSWYGSFNNTNPEEYFGKDKTDTFLIRPKLLEMSIHGLLNDYLGRNGPEASLKACKNSIDCAQVSYCSGNIATCSGTHVCVCSRAHYHPALDISLEPSPNDSTGYFVISDRDMKSTPMFTEPYWSSSIGIVIYRDSSLKTEYWILGGGFVVALISILCTISLKRRMKKEKLY